MPLTLWLLFGGLAAFLVVKSASATAAATATALPSGSGTMPLMIAGPSGTGPFQVPVESTLPLVLQQQFATFFVNATDASFTDQTVADFSNQLANQGFSIAAGSAQSVWQMVIAAMNALVPTSSASPQASSSCPPGYEEAPYNKFELGGGKGCVPTSSSGTTIGPILMTPQGFKYQQMQGPTINPPKA